MVANTCDHGIDLDDHCRECENEEIVMQKARMGVLKEYPKDILECAHEVIENKTRSHVQAARTLADYILQTSNG